MVNWRAGVRFPRETIPWDIYSTHGERRIGEEPRTKMGGVPCPILWLQRKSEGDQKSKPRNLTNFSRKSVLWQEEKEKIDNQKEKWGAEGGEAGVEVGTCQQ